MVCLGDLVYISLFFWLCRGFVLLTCFDIVLLVFCVCFVPFVVVDVWMCCLGLVWCWCVWVIWFSWRCVSGFFYLVVACLIVLFLFGCLLWLEFIGWNWPGVG